MTQANSRLLVALALAVLLHLLPFLPEWLSDKTPPPPSPASPPLDARLRPPPLPQQAPLRIEQATSKPETKPEPPPSPRTQTSTPRPAPNWQESVRQQLRQQQKRGAFYPEEAIARGLEGEVLVLMILDAAGQVVAARVEQGSGHPILDDAAVRSVRALSSIPADAPREILLPVRFRLH